MRVHNSDDLFQMLKFLIRNCVVVFPPNWTEDPQETRGPHQQESLDPSSGIAVPGGARLKKEDNEPEGSSTKFVEPKKVSY